MDIEYFIQKTSDASHPDEVFALFVEVMASYGFDKCIFGGSETDGPFVDRFHITLPAPILLNNYPEDWTKHYLAREYAKVDPVIRLMPRMWGPLIWKNVPKIITPTRIQTKLMREAEEAGLRNGVSIPMRGPDGETFVISLASEYDGDLDLQQILPRVRVLTAQFFFAYTDLWSKESPQVTHVMLTRREQECLQWSAVGKSGWEISHILGISEPTVRFHMTNSYKKLGASNRIAAIVRALRWGLIHL